MIYNKLHGFQVYSLISYDIWTHQWNHHHHQDNGHRTITHRFFLCPFVTLPSCPSSLSPSSHSKHLLIYFLSLWISFYFSIILNKWNHVVFGGGWSEFFHSANMHAKSLQSCPTLCDPMDCSPPDSSVHGILQARILEWVAMPFSRGSSWPRKGTCVSYVSCTGDRWVLYH